ncbi:hypothetical protein JXA63_05460 [Candidatus Woesebacteria bacterium]|nr:hypothetical protein [Candidatus Woesebacteria bacterium]
MKGTEGQPKYNPDNSMIRADSTKPGDIIEIFPANCGLRVSSEPGEVIDIFTTHQEPRKDGSKRPKNTHIIVIRDGEKISIGGGTAIRKLNRGFNFMRGR